MRFYSFYDFIVEEYSYRQNNSNLSFFITIRDNKMNFYIGSYRYSKYCKLTNEVTK
jgi:hypothetical protein